jgi:hypothetical protein
VETPSRQTRQRTVEVGSIFSLRGMVGELPMSGARLVERALLSREFRSGYNAEEEA